MSSAIKSPQTDPACSWAARYAERLLSELCGETFEVDHMSDHPAIAWKRAGMFGLSGAADGPSRMVPLPLASAADGALLALKSIAQFSKRLPDSGAALLGERTRLLSLTRKGRSSTMGHCRLIECAGGRIALNLARDDDWGLLPALLQGVAADSWDSLARACKVLRADDLVRQGVELGMAIAKDQLAVSEPWLARKQLAARASASETTPLIVDLSTLWAGPLAGSLLRAAAGKVIKVESTHRPDGGREGNPAFYDLLNGGKQSIALDFRSDEGRHQLKAIIDAADIVIEASRPRALRQLGIDAEGLVTAKPGKVWMRIVAHGGDENRIGFGDDIGVAAGLPTIMEHAWGEPLMVGDAIADPLSGLHAALAAWQSWQSGGGELLTVSMRDVVRSAMQISEDLDLTNQAQDWQAMAETNDTPPYPQRHPASRAESLGQSTQAVLERLC